MKKISLMKSAKPARPLPLGGGMGRRASKAVYKALGVASTVKIHPQMAQKLLTHPDKSIANAAKKLMGQY